VDSLSAAIRFGIGLGAFGIVACGNFACSTDTEDSGSESGGSWQPPADAQDPGPPQNGDSITHIGVNLRTGQGSSDGTNANKVSLCLTEDHCWRLNLADVDDFRKGEVDHYSLDPNGLSREAFSTPTLRSENGTDAWRPDCLSISLNGQQVYCQNDLGFLMGDAMDELESWTDPDGLHLSCPSCWEDALTHGPIQGAPLPNGADIWIRTDNTRSAQLLLKHVSSGREWIADWGYALPEDDFTLVLKAEGLEPNTAYTYTVALEGGEKAGPFPIQTAPVLGASGQFNIAFGSCSKFGAQPVFDTLAEHDLDLFLFVGDNHYGNTADEGSLRWYYQWAHGMAARRPFMSQTPILATWDDHDFTGNNTDGSAPGKETALQVFRHYWPNPASGTSSTEGTFFSNRLGDIEFFLLDVRYHQGTDGTLLGNGQTEWLQQALLASEAQFKVLVGGSQWTAKGSNDSWKSFLPDRDALFSFIGDNKLSGVVLLSGDIHRSSFRRLVSDQAGYSLPELTSSPLSNTTTACKSDDEIQACYNSRPSYIQMEFDTTLSDPTLKASLRNDAGTLQNQWLIRLSELSPE
jgi:alkaline phosphatase D